MRKCLGKVVLVAVVAMVLLALLALMLRQSTAQQPLCDPTPTVTDDYDPGQPAEYEVWLPVVWLPLVVWPP